MKNNVFVFGDTFWYQKIGTAMRTPPIPTYANLFFAIHKDRILPKYSANFLIYKRYIDDIFGIWVPSNSAIEDDTNWKKFVRQIDDYHGLKWIFSPKCDKVDFLDITVSINDRYIHTTLYEKSLNLYLYIPPHSAHLPEYSPALSSATATASNHSARTRPTKHNSFSNFSRDYEPAATRPLHSLRSSTEHISYQLAPLLPPSTPISSMTQRRN